MRFVRRLLCHSSRRALRLSDDGMVVAFRVFSVYKWNAGTGKITGPTGIPVGAYARLYPYGRSGTDPYGCPARARTPSDWVGHRTLPGPAVGASLEADRSAAILREG